MRLAFMTTRAHWWCAFNWLSTRTPRSFSALLLSQQPVSLHVVVLSQMQDFAFAFAKLHEVPVSPFLQDVKVAPNGKPFPPVYWPVLSASFAALPAPCPFGVIRKLVQLKVSSSRSLMKVLSRTNPNTGPWGISLRVRLQAVDHYPLSLVFQTVFHPVWSPSSLYLLFQATCFLWETMSKALLNSRQMTHITRSTRYKESVIS